MPQPIKSFNLADIYGKVGAVRSRALQNRIAEEELKEYELERERKTGRRDVFKSRYQPPTPARRENVMAAAGPPVGGGAMPAPSVGYDVPARAGGMDYEAAVTDLYNMGDIEGAQALEASMATKQKKGLETGKMTREEAIAKRELFGRIVRDVKDEPSWNRAKQVMRDMGITPADQPDLPYSPEVQQEINNVIRFSEGTVKELREAKGKGKDSTALMKNVNFLVEKGIAGNDEEAFGLLRESRTMTKEQFLANARLRLSSNWMKEPEEVEADMESLAKWWTTNIGDKKKGKGKQTLDKDTVKQLLLEAGGDKAKARALAKERGFNF